MTLKKMAQASSSIALFPFKFRHALYCFIEHTSKLQIQQGTATGPIVGLIWTWHWYSAILAHRPKLNPQRSSGQISPRRRISGLKPIIQTRFNLQFPIKKEKSTFSQNFLQKLFPNFTSNKFFKATHFPGKCKTLEITAASSSVVEAKHELFILLETRKYPMRPLLPNRQSDIQTRCTYKKEKWKEGKKEKKKKDDQRFIVSP